jgi:hypothetical protein
VIATDGSEPIGGDCPGMTAGGKHASIEALREGDYQVPGDFGPLFLLAIATRSLRIA